MRLSVCLIRVVVDRAGAVLLDERRQPSGLGEPQNVLVRRCCLRDTKGDLRRYIHSERADVGRRLCSDMILDGRDNSVVHIDVAFHKLEKAEDSKVIWGVRAAGADRIDEQNVLVGAFNRRQFSCVSRAVIDPVEAVSERLRGCGNFDDHRVGLLLWVEVRNLCLSDWNGGIGRQGVDALNRHFCREFRRRAEHHDSADIVPGEIGESPRVLRFILVPATLAVQEFSCRCELDSVEKGARPKVVLKKKGLVCAFR